jgi:hypothetical protein
MVGKNELSAKERLMNNNYAYMTLYKNSNLSEECIVINKQINR